MSQSYTILLFFTIINFILDNFLKSLCHNQAQPTAVMTILENAKTVLKLSVHSAYNYIGSQRPQVKISNA